MTPEPVRFCCSPFSPGQIRSLSSLAWDQGVNPCLCSVQCEHSLDHWTTRSPLHVPFKRRVYVLPPSGSSVPTPLMAFKARHPGGLSSKCRVPGLEEPDAGSDSLLAGQNICNRDYAPVCGHLPRVWVLPTLCLCPCCLSHYVSVCLSLVVEDLFCSSAGLFLRKLLCHKL